MEVGPELRLDDAASIRAFVDTYRRQQRPLHVLVNNAGANYMSDGVTADGVPLLTQVICLPQSQFSLPPVSVHCKPSSRHLYFIQVAAFPACHLALMQRQEKAALW